MKTRFFSPRIALATALAVLLISSLFGPAAALAVAARPFSPFGMSGHLIGDYPRAQTDRELRLVSAAGAGWLRLDVPWRFIEPKRGAHASLPLRQLDYIVAGAAKRGVRIEAVVVEFPNWSNGNKGMWAPPTNDADFENFMKFMSKRYAGKIDHWELGNEVNETEFWKVSRAKSAVRYVHFLQAGYRGVKAGNPGAKVISAGLAGSDEHYLQEMYNAGAKGYFDLLGVHAYTHGQSPYAKVDSTEPGCSYTWLGKMKSTMESNGDVGKKIWITETGWQTSDVAYHVTHKTQAKYTFDAYKRLYRDFPYVETLFVYGVRDAGSNRRRSSDNYGLLRRNYSQKLAYAAYKRACWTYFKTPTKLSVTSSSYSVPSGATFVLSGVLTQAPGGRLQLQRRVGSRWIQVRSVATLRGAYSTKLRLTSCGTKRYRIYYAGSRTRRAAASRVLTIRVR